VAAGGCVWHFCLDETAGLYWMLRCVRVDLGRSSPFGVRMRQLLSCWFVVLMSVIRNNYMHWSM
jgi:hypothetical protein